jgi:cytochrome bd ubiquinol oxidase subunit I
MTVLELSRWQFGITTVYHFIFVPLTIGLSLPIRIVDDRSDRARNDDR